MSGVQLEPMIFVKSSKQLGEPIKRRLLSKHEALQAAVSKIEFLSGISYPSYYVDPTLTITVSADLYGVIGALYARTIPVEANGELQIFVQVSAALILLARKATVLRVLGHEFLHYLDLVEKFSTGKLYSEISPSSVFEERFQDGHRMFTPHEVFAPKRILTKELEQDQETGFSDEKLNEKCRKLWIEKGLPTVRIASASNQVKISVGAISKVVLDPQAVKLVSRLHEKK